MTQTLTLSDPRLTPDHITLEQIKTVLDDPHPETTEHLAFRAGQLTERHFGRTISLYTPLYLSNYCSSHCTYCGFHSHHRIPRIRLNPDQMHREMAAIAGTGIENVLLLTGESYQATPLPYLEEAVRTARQYFTSVSLEVHPLQTEDYRRLYTCGVDGITVYQETYDRARYKEVHLSGLKADYDFRYETPARAARAGIRQISMGILLGLGETATDLLVLIHHLRRMERDFPGVEYAVSFPRLRRIKGRDFAVCDVGDIPFLRIICLTRLLFPRVGITLSTREAPFLRDRFLGLGVTRISAGSNTSVGGYALVPSEEQSPQFDISDNRPVAEIISMLKSRQFDPVRTDWRPFDEP